MTGRYLIRRGSETLGTETFAITRTGTLWRAEGTILLRWPAAQTQGYTLVIDEKTNEPISMTAFVEVDGERVSIEGHKDDVYFNFASQTLRGAKSRQLPYAFGTVLDFPSPIFNTFVLAILGPTLALRTPVRVRTIIVSVPQLEPTVMIQTYELHASEGATKKIAVGSVGAERPTALWVREDGLPTRVRTWIDAGAPFELTLEATTSTVSN